MMVTAEHVAALARLLARQELAVGALEMAVEQRDAKIAELEAKLADKGKG